MLLKPGRIKVTTAENSYVESHSKILTKASNSLYYIQNDVDVAWKNA